MGGCSDQALTVAALALFADRPSTVSGVAHIRLQESDRIAAAADAVARLGGRLEERPDGFTVHPAPPTAVGPARIDPHGDHRVAMAFALAGLRRPGVSVADPGVAAKTFPGFWDALDALRGGPVGGA
jgi:3-phosphoshikimate 1-carboxyvinyltransferase